VGEPQATQCGVAQHRRLLHIVGDSKFGGGAKVILDLARVGAHLGLSVDVLTTDPVFADAAERQGHAVVALDVIWRNVRPVRDLVGAKRLLHHLREHPYDLVHTHTSKAGFIGRWAAARADVPTVVHTVHGFAFHEASPPGVVWAYSRLERLAARWCDRLVTVSEFHRQWAIHLGIAPEDRVIAIPNGISPLASPLRTRDEVRSEWGVAGDEVAVLSVGRLAAQKGLEYLIGAIPLLAQHVRRRLVVVLAGAGPSEDALRQLADRLGVRSAVRFLGFQQDVSSLLAACDIVALPTEREGLSIALLEAMAAGKPVVTTTVTSNPEVIGDSECALLVTPRDPGALSDALATLIADRARGEAMGRRAMERQREHYSLDAMLDGYRRLYLDLMDPHTRRGARSDARAQ